MYHWIVCQLGAREHYAIPRALYKRDQLKLLLTDAWTAPDLQKALSSFSYGRKLAERYHIDLPPGLIKSFTGYYILNEMKNHIFTHNKWRSIINRNNWFQEKSINYLDKNIKILKECNEPPILFSYSYSSRRLFEFAKKNGMLTVLGQIDPGIVEEDIIEHEVKKHIEFKGKWERAPTSYWDEWIKECELADIIIVNSEWSKSALERTGIDKNKITVIPLAYSKPHDAKIFNRKYPDRFTQDRPLQLLFLGQIIVRKGIVPLLEAMELLKDQPVGLNLVGPCSFEIPYRYANNPKIRWFDSVPRNSVYQYYKNADVFIFPTLSDGFGITQLEAQAFRLPIISSKNCGKVITDNVDGIILDKNDSQSISNTVLRLMTAPTLLKKYSNNIREDQFTIDHIAESLSSIL